MQIVVGLLKRDDGEVERPERLGYCPQVPMVWEKLTVSEHFELFAEAYGLDQDAEQAEDSLLRNFSSSATATSVSRSSPAGPARSSTWPWP